MSQMDHHRAFQCYYSCSESSFLSFPYNDIILERNTQRKLYITAAKPIYTRQYQEKGNTIS